MSEGLSSLLAKLESFSSLLHVEVSLHAYLSELLSILLGLAVRSVVLVILGELANICLPSKVLAVDESDGLVRLSVGLMLLVSIETCGGSSVGLACCLLLIGLGVLGLIIGWLLGLSHSLLLLLLYWLRGDLVLGCDNCDLYGIGLSLDRNRLLHLVMCLLLGKEANNLVLAHAILLLVHGWDGLHETDHGLVALRVELAVVASLD